MVRETHTRKPKAVSRGRRESVKARKERLELERLAAARFEFEHGPQRRMVLVMASDPEEAVEMAVAQATAGDWRLRASVPKVKGEYTVEFLGSDRWMVPVTVKLPAKQLDSWPNWH
jgi:sarcosine oxidase gamma subunit